MYICPYIFTGPGKTSIITMEIQAGTVRLGRTFIMKLSSDLNQTMARFHQLLDVQTNFDIVYHTLTIGGKQALIYFVDGLTKDEVLLRIMQGFASGFSPRILEKIRSLWRDRPGGRRKPDPGQPSLRPFLPSHRRL